MWLEDLIREEKSQEQKDERRSVLESYARHNTKRLMGALCDHLRDCADTYSGATQRRILVDSFGVEDAYTFPGVYLRTVSFPVIELTVIGNQHAAMITCERASRSGILVKSKPEKIYVNVLSKGPDEFYFSINGEIMNSLEAVSARLLRPLLEVLKTAY